MQTQNRRTLLKSAAVIAAAAGSARGASGSAAKKVYRRGPKPETPPLYSSAVSFGDLLFLSGKGAPGGGDFRTQARYVLDEIEKELVNAGSSMEKVLKVNVYLSDIKDYAALNEVYKGRFGENPPVRTTVAPAGGLPNNYLVEIDAIAHL